MFHSLVLFLTTLLLTVLQILTVIMIILFCMFLHQIQLLRPLHSFPDGSSLLKKLLVILYISVRDILSSREPLVYWIKFQKIMILTHLQKPNAIQSGMQQ